MSNSYNGWPASKNPADFGGLDNRVIPGTNVKLAPGLRAGDVATVLFYVAEQLHKRVEPITEYAAGDDWGYNFRPNTNNPSQLSCHGSGTAFDYNATQHPNGRKNTWTPAQYREIDEILYEVDNVVRQLRGYDEMHFEICKDERAVRSTAEKIRNGSVKTSVIGPRALFYEIGKPVLFGDDVKRLQKVLSRWYPSLNLMADGYFGPATDSAVRRLQSNSGLVVDGIVGPTTRRILGL